MIEASIIILTKNAGSNFEQLMEKIFSLDFDKEFEVIIIDSGSTDEVYGSVENGSFKEIDP